MATKGPITKLIDELKAGDEEAAQGLWERYYSRLVRLARKKLADAPRRMADEEDAALSAFNSVCMGARQGRFPLLSDRNDLWRLLVVITARKVIDQIKRERRRTRRSPKTLGESALLALSFKDEDSRGGLHSFAADEPTPEFAAIAAEEVKRFLDSLPSQTLREITLWKLQGHTIKEIAKRLGYTQRTVERRLAIIRRLLESRGL